MDPPLTGSTSFADLAEELRCLANEQALGVEALELFAARSGEAVFKRVLDRARLSARRAGELHALLLALVPHEAEVRALTTRRAELLHAAASTSR